MNKYIKTGIVLLFLPVSLFAQNNVDKVLSQIEKNNTTLSALSKSTDAQKVGNKTGIFLKNPEVEFNYLLGNPSSIGNRTDFSIKQSFDFPTAYGYKNQISDIKNEQTKLEYRKQQKTLLLQARNICIDLIYTNGLKSEYTKRLNHAQSIAKSYKLKFDAGDASILEFNKAQLNLLNLSNKIELLEIDRTALLSELTRLNGGVAIELADNEFQSPIIQTDFDKWYTQAEQSNPVLNWLKQEIEISKKQLNLNKALALPKVQTGYMSETIVGQQFRGISVGLSIPLWENKNTVKYAKANAVALETVAADNKVQFYNQLKILHSKAISLQSNVTEYRSKLQSFNSSDLLKKALDKGEISLIDFIMELSIYYENVNKVLELDRDMNKAVAELNCYL
ncbi:MAG: TolC family protein [Paludibacter sp.]